MAPTPALLRVLCVEDNPDDADLIAFALERGDPDRHYVISRIEDAAGLDAALDAPAADAPDLILCDYTLPRFSPQAVLRTLRERGRDIPMIVVTRAIGEEAAVAVLREGAHDHVTKDKLGTLPQVIERVLQEREQAREKARLAAELATAYQRLATLSARMVVAQERERLHISRELHDQLGQSLTAVVIHLHAARGSRDSAVANQHADTAIELASAAIQQVKTLSFNLRPAQLDLLGLTAAVEAAVQRVAEPAGLQHVVRTRGTEPRPPGELAPVALRVVQEALTNCVRHARASRLWVRLRFLPHGHIGVLVVDDGVGFDRSAVLDAPTSERNIGLHSLFERVELAGGRMRLRTRPGHGVAIRVIL